MNVPLDPSTEADGAWPVSGRRTPVPDTSMLPGTGQAPPAAVETLKRMVQGAHDAVDNFADRATPKVRQLSDSFDAAGASLRARVDGLRGTVRSHPLASLAAALLLGAAVAHVARRGKPTARG